MDLSKIGNGCKMRVLHKKGHYIWMETLAKPVAGERGKSVQIVSISRDITQHKDGTDVFEKVVSDTDRCSNITRQLCIH
ncbi:PAS domain S-box protein [Paenibacillus amylolyticus]|nr:PAS domain S-box protein [Paenibacillus amylolyticus]